MTPIGLGWRVHSWWAVAVAVRGPAEAPEIDAPALIRSVEQAAASTAAVAIQRLVSSLGPIAAIGVVGGNRRLPELPQILVKHARLHQAERDLYEQAIIQGATSAGLPVATIPATGTLFDHASRVLGVALEPSLAALGKSIGPPWQKNYKEAAAAALVALAGGGQ